MEKKLAKKNDKKNWQRDSWTPMERKIEHKKIPPISLPPFHREIIYYSKHFLHHTHIKTCHFFLYLVALLPLRRRRKKKRDDGVFGGGSTEDDDDDDDFDDVGWWWWSSSSSFVSSTSFEEDEAKKDDFDDGNDDGGRQ